ncbi:GNAT family N-acetyltransferase [Clostridium sp. UBA6640]|uniref:GNAT family N-acetyltransferase n=1 Tax=Clostridium sp. UBA6640 TaxID=1946370 RepID=UPI0025C2B31C|nr:GNAT family N-acetyltransferase [Clostridium sp. UBA6640]
MEILTFNKLCNRNKEDLYNFINNSDIDYNKSFEDMIKVFESEVFNYGENVFVIFENGYIKGSISVITRETKVSGDAYITGIHIEEDTLQKNSKILSSLMGEAEEACDTPFTKKIILGITNKIMYLSSYIESYNFKYVHNATIMKYDLDKILQLEDSIKVEFIPLTDENKDEFRTIHNEAFKGSPNAATLSKEEVQDFIFQYRGNEDLVGIVKNNNNNVGIYMLADIDNEGWIDNIGVLSSSRRKGIGKAIIKKSIQLLKKRNVRAIKLLVISSNEVAYNLYNKYGFKEEAIFSKWFEKKLEKCIDKT